VGPSRQAGSRSRPAGCGARPVSARSRIRSARCGLWWRRRGPAVGAPTTAVGDLADLLDIDVDQLARAVLLVAQPGRLGERGTRWRTWVSLSLAKATRWYRLWRRRHNRFLAYPLNRSRAVRRLARAPSGWAFHGGRFGSAKGPWAPGGLRGPVKLGRGQQHKEHSPCRATPVKWIGQTAIMPMSQLCR
jgi:hypothetical protein